MYVWLDHVCMYVCVRCDQGGQGHWKAHTRVQGCLGVRTDERAPRSQVGQGRTLTYIHTCGIGVLTMYVCMYYRARVALTGLAIAEYFRDQEGQGAHLHTYIHAYKIAYLSTTMYVCICMCVYGRRVVVRGQHFPFHPGRFRGVCSVRSHPFRCRVSTCMYVWWESYPCMYVVSLIHVCMSMYVCMV